MATAALNKPGRDYMRSQVETASQTQLILMLYDGAIRFLSLGVEKMQERPPNLEAKNSFLVKGQRIIAELISTLDLDHGGDVAANLHRLYSYMLPRIVEANLRDDPTAVAEVIGILRDLRGSWEEVDRQVRYANGDL